MPINDAFMLPKRVRTMEQMADLLQTEQAELTQTSRTISALEQQLTISTSTFLLPRHEAIYDLPSNPSESAEVRRARLLGKLNTRGSTTVESIREMVQIVTGCKGDVIENPTDYSFEVIVYLQFPDATDKMAELLRQIEEIKPAHLFMYAEGAVQAVPFQNQNHLAFVHMNVRLRVNNFGEGAIYLDGRRNLDGSWVLIQLFSKGITLHQFRVSAKAPPHQYGQALSVEIMARVKAHHRLCSHSLHLFSYSVNNLGVGEHLLDGKFPLDGSWQLSHTYTKGVTADCLRCALRAQNPQGIKNTLRMFCGARNGNSAATRGEYTASVKNEGKVTEHHFQGAVQAVNPNMGTWYLTADNMYLLDGSVTLDGTRQLAYKIRSEI